jgi:hypothetical protein
VSSITTKGLDIDKVTRNVAYLVSCGIRIQFYILKEYENILYYYKDDEKIKYTIVDYMFNSWVYQEIEKEIQNNGKVELPTNRNQEKDTFEFIYNSHRKHEFLEDVVKKNPQESSHFAWIDYNILDIFKNMNESREFLNWLNQVTLAESFLTFPGCWSKLEKEKIDDVLNSVHWRFCGGFLMGDMESIQQFCELYKEQFPTFLREHHTLVWDFNFWAWLECFFEERWNPKWYRGDHNDCILHCSADCYTKTLANIHKKTVYEYPQIDTYYPTSASYLFYEGKHWLNTRYVNYWIYPNGCYLFHNPNRLIENKNMLSELDEENLIPLSYKEIQETIDLPVTSGTISTGLEDIRFYEWNEKVKYIATTTGYSPSGKSRMIVGVYDIEKGAIEMGDIIESPNPDSWCEKNWIPIVIPCDENGHSPTIDELFIYKWFPLQIGHVDYGTKELIVTHIHPVTMPLFNKIKGSTIFYDTLDGLLGVVHFCEDHGPRHYYHMLVVLDPITYKLKKYSETFCFEKLGVEYCIGFTIRGCSSKLEEGEPDKKEYVFWISRHDRDPMMIQIGTDEIKWIQSIHI